MKRPLPWARMVGGGALAATGVLAVVLVVERTLLGPGHPSIPTLNLGGGLAAGLAATLVVGGILAARVADLRRQLMLVTAAEAKFRAFVEGAPDAVVIVDQRGRIVLVNTQVEHMFGFTRAELQGVSVEVLIPERFRGDHAVHRGQYMDQPRARPMGVGLELFGRRKDGTEFAVEISLSPIQTREGLLVASTIRDVTERKRLDAERARGLEQVRELERLKELDRFKTEFINMAAHELGTPLTPIRLQISLLRGPRGDGMTEEQRRAMQILDRNVDRLTNLVQDILEVARIQAGRLGVHREPVDVNPLVLEAAESFQDLARVAGVALESRLTPDLEVHADPKRLTQVLFNLLSNAIKFTPPGGRVVLETSRAAGETLVKVIDTGAGLRAEDMPKLFRPFSQVHDTMQRTRGGTGLGLYISKGIIELHGGRIWVESPGLGKGATFAFAIPHEAEVAVPQDIEVTEQQPEDALAKRAKELI